MNPKINEVELPAEFSVDASNIPDVLKDVDRWVMWKAGPRKPTGKFPKFPVNSHGLKMNGLVAENWLTFEDAHAGYCAGKCDGVGFVLDGSPVDYGNEQLYPIALDFDNCEASQTEYRELWLKLGKPYVEVSPSGKGLRMFALSRVVLKGGNDGHGHEMYFDRRFVTVTGNSAKGKLCEATGQLVELHDGWFPTKTMPARQQVKGATLARRLAHPDTPESAEAIARVKDMLSYVSADCSYEQWRDIIWSVLSTGWASAEELVLIWSMTVPERYEQEAFSQLVKDFDPGKGITLGTLYHHAELAGWVSKPGTVASATGKLTSTALTTAGGKFRLLTAAEVMAQPIAGYRVRGLLPSEGLAAVYGPSGSGKSFLVADLCFAIAAGLPEWFGRKVKKAPVIYVALEGGGGLRNRISALEAHYKRQVPNDFRFVFGELTLKNIALIEEFANEALNALSSGTVVVIDTLNQAAPGADENSSQDMGEIISAAKLLGERLRGLVILVHHTGKDASRGLRGHSSLLAALDAAIEVENKAGVRAWSATKVKDDATGGPQAFQLKSYTVGTDEDGLDVTSCAVERSLLPQTSVRPVTGKNQTPAMAALKPHLDAVGVVLPKSQAIEIITRNLTSAPARRRQYAKELLTKLVNSGHLVMNDGCVSKP
ncbi:MAG: putative helicase [Pseudomonadota bacterium]|jgi:hypothetical protein